VGIDAIGSGGFRKRGRKAILVELSRSEDARSDEKSLSGAHLLLRPLVGRLDSIATLDYIRLETDWTRATVQLEEKSAGIAKDRPSFVASP
jgi:hypothetical protein